MRARHSLLRRPRAVGVVLCAVVLGLGAGTGRAASPVGPCPRAATVLAQQCALASALAVTFTAPGLSTSAHGIDGTWVRNNQAEDFFQANAPGRALTTLTGLAGELAAVPGNNLSPREGVGEAFSTAEQVVEGSDSQAGAYAWHEQQVDVMYHVGTRGQAWFSVESVTRDYSCHTYDGLHVVSRDCVAGIHLVAYPDSSAPAPQLQVHGTRVTVVQPTVFRLDIVRNDGRGVMTGMPSRSWTGTWSYTGTVSAQRSDGTATWSSQATTDPVSVTLRAQRRSRSWYAESHRD